MRGSSESGPQKRTAEFSNASVVHTPTGVHTMEWKVRCPCCGNEFVIRFPKYELNTIVIRNRLVKMDPCCECRQDSDGFELIEVLEAPGCVKA